MRWICLAVIIPVAAATIMFALRNLEIVTMSVLGFIAHLSLALLRQSYDGSRRSIMGLC
jgi:lipopolysaccharide assembly protein A